MASPACADRDQTSHERGWLLQLVDVHISKRNAVCQRDRCLALVDRGHDALHISRDRAPRVRCRDVSVCVEQERNVILELHILEEGRGAVGNPERIAVYLDLLRIADGWAALTITAAHTGIRDQRLSVRGVERHDIILFQAGRVDDSPILDDLVFARDVC